MDRSRQPAIRPHFDATRPTAELALSRLAVGRTLYGPPAAFTRRSGDGISVRGAATLVDLPFRGGIPITRVRDDGYAITIARGFRPEGTRVGREIPVDVYVVGANGQRQLVSEASGPGL